MDTIYPSPGACGETSDYSLSWSVERVPSGTGQRELLGQPNLIGIAAYSTVDLAEHVLIGTKDQPPEQGTISSIVMTSADGRVVHPAQNPAGSVTNLSVLAGYSGGLGQFVVAATREGDMTLGSTSISPDTTTFEPVPVTPGPGIIRLTGLLFLGNHNIFVGMDDGTIHYLVRDASSQWSTPGIFDTGAGRRLIGLAAYFAERDGYGHVISAWDDGDIVDHRFTPAGVSQEPAFQDVRANISRPVAAAAFFGSDGYHHIFVGAEDGNVHEIWYPGVATAGPMALRLA